MTSKGLNRICTFLARWAILAILINNLLYDFSQTGIPFDHVDPEDLVKPPKWKIDNIRRFMIFIGPISFIFDYSTYALMWFVFGATSVDNQALFQTGWFVESLMTQTLIVHVIRTFFGSFFPESGFFTHAADHCHYYGNRNVCHFLRLQAV